MSQKNGKLASIIKEALYRMTKKDIPFTPFNYYRVFTQVALESGLDRDVLRGLLYSDVKLEEEAVEEMKQKVLDIARNVKDVTLSVEDSLKKTEKQHDDVLKTLDGLDSGTTISNIANEIERIKYINMALKTELESARKILEKQREAIDSLKELSLKDHLTGLYSRRYMDKVLKEMLYDFERYGKIFSVIMIDLDNFKQINDLYGHRSGDIVLRDFAMLLERITRYTDSCIRYGGDEFIVVLPETGLDEAKKVAEKIQKAFSSITFKKGADEFKCTVSIGVTTVREGDTISSILERVDKALYETKHKGKAGITVV